MAIIRFNSPNEEELSPDELSALLTSVMPDVAGYRVIRMIGRGGMSYVYLGVQESLDRQVAIKITAPHILKDEISKQRFEQEARTIAKLEHPCIVSIHEVGRTPQGLIYYVMPYLSKGHLGQRDFRDNEARVVEVLRALLAALDYAHARGIVHRDVKAENVLFDNADRPLLTDFGIALSKRNAARITTEGLAVGSAGYMAPEQARGEQVDGRADLYSVGVLAFELLTGSLPYQATEALALALMHAQDPVPLLPPERRHWQPFIATAMAKSREARFKNAQQMLSALNEVSMRIGAPTSGNFEHIPSQSSNRKNWLIPSIAAAAVIAVGALATIQPVWLSQIGQMFFGGPVESTPIVLSSDEISEAMAEPLVDAIEPVTSSPVLTAVDAGAFVAITAGFNSSPLPYDPTIRGERELASIDRQITQSRLTTPRGDNAFDSLMAYRRFAPNDVRVGRYADRVLLSFTDQIARLQKGKQDEAAKALHIKSVELVSTFKLENSKSWTDYSQRSLATVQSMLQQAGRSRNQSGIAAAISFAKA